MAKFNLQEEIKRITSEIAAGAERKALEVSTQAVAKAAEVADLAKVKAMEVNSMAVAKALDASTLAAEKAASAAVAAASVATAINLDLSYIKKDISDTKLDIKAINEKLDNKYTTKDETAVLRKEVEDTTRILNGRAEVFSQFNTVKAVVFGLVGLILTSVVGGLMFLIINK